MAILQKKKAADITDEEVVESYELPCPPLPFYFPSMLQTILLLEGVVGHLQWCLGHLISHHLTPTPEHFSYKDMVDPAKPQGNFMLQYLERAKLIHKFGAALFVHGGVSDKNCGKLPHSDDECGDVEAWMERLNGFCASEVKAFKESPTATGDFHYKKRPGHLLMDYGVSEQSVPPPPPSLPLRAPA